MAGSALLRYRDVDDGELAAKAAAGDREALEVLLGRHQDRVFDICRRICGNDADAADATQDALVAITRGLGRFEGRSAFTTWMYRVVANAALGEQRRKARRPVPIEEAGLEVGHDGGVDRVGDAELVDWALQQLPPSYRTAIVLREREGLSYIEIGEVLDIPMGTVKTRISRARLALAELGREAGLGRE